MHNDMHHDMYMTRLRPFLLVGSIEYDGSLGRLRSEQRLRAVHKIGAGEAAQHVPHQHAAVLQHTVQLRHLPRCSTMSP